MIISKFQEIKAHNGAIYSVDGFDDFIFTGSGDSFSAQWCLLSGNQEKFSIKADKSIYKLKLIANNKFIFIGLSSGSLHIIDLEKRQEIKHYTQHKSAIFEITENEKKNHIYTTDADGNLAVWQSNTWELLLFLPLGVGKIRNILISGDGETLILACQNGKIMFIDSKHFNEKFEIYAHENGSNSLKFIPSNNENVLISGGKDGFLKIWDISKKQRLIGIPAHNFGIYGIEFFNFGKNFITISRDKSFKLWDTNKLEVISKIERKQGGHSHAINAIYKKNENEFITVSDDKRIIHWNINN